ncbi:hypothetical protein ACOYR1_15545 [Thalassotalea piscium]|uniref:hypothetical protein n=1 Tax=Colwellia sp. PAMC 21821 TaxID=1816219 RepID=UPI0009C0FB5A|nr:hypothetical protein [Colwellia sp. PAMC 21821]ARD45905.1 hypothetical protein A3Q33_17370 [Colwellia sp. PAMC 21821]
MNNTFKLKQFIIVMLLTSIWIHVAEVARAILVAFPMMEAFYAGKLAVGPMAVSNALIWGIWDTILASTIVFIYWLCAQSFGNNVKSIIISATVTCMATLGVFWIGSVNSGLGTWEMAYTLVPIAWLEMLIGAFLASKLYARYR